MRWPRLRIRLTIELGEQDPPKPPEPSYGDGYMDNAGTLAENVGHPRMAGFQREEATELTESDRARR